MRIARQLGISVRENGYLKNPAETRQTFVDIEGKTWCRTGDFVTMSAEGDIEFIDRRADLIKHKGYRVSAARVESVLQDYPAVVAACVVGAPDVIAGEQVKAFVILKTDVRGVTSYELTKHCRERLLPYEVPDYVEFRDMLPKSKIWESSCAARCAMKSSEKRRAPQVGHTKADDSVAENEFAESNHRRLCPPAGFSLEIGILSLCPM